MTEPFYHHYLEFFLNFIVIMLGALTKETEAKGDYSRGETAEDGE